ncbi:MAG TPA: hypothetical protein VME44_02080 [Streptosporangiaceae bacterium]|nr:hypothetical protein [Streptosporangiaceae bacterium]
MHPYMAQGVARERVADFIRVAEANQRARDGAERGSRRRFGSRRSRSAGSQPSHTSPHLVVAHSGPAESEYDRSDELVKAGG